MATLTIDQSNLVGLEVSATTVDLHVGGAITVEGGASPEQIATVVEEYLAENPPDATDPNAIHAGDGAGGALSGEFPNPGLNAEAVQDLVGGMAGVGLEYDDATGELNVTVSTPLSDDDPAALSSTADPGTSTAAARGDHVHPLPNAAQVGAATSSDISSAISTHVAATDPHGDRAYTDAAIAALPPSTSADGSVGPNWVAASDAPAALRTAVSDAGGAVCDGTADQTEIEAALAAYTTVYLTEGTFTVSATVDLAQHGQNLIGAGIESTIIAATSAVTGRVVYSNDLSHIAIRNLSVDGSALTGTVHGIEVDASSNSGWPSHQTNEACTVLADIQVHGVSGHGVYLTGSYNKDAKLYNVDVHDAAGDGFKVTVPDGTMHQCVAGSCTGYGFNFDGASNWRVTNSKAWYAHTDGFVLGPTASTARIDLIGCEAQDCYEAGFRVTKATAPTLVGCKADSNSNTSGNAGVYSGFEIYTATGSYPEGGAVITGCNAYDKSEGGRGYRQAYGFRFKSGVRNLTFTGCGFGDTDAHHNATGDYAFNTAGDETNATNHVSVRGSTALVRSTRTLAGLDLSANRSASEIKTALAIASGDVSGLGTAATADIDTDGTAAANSDTRVMSQKAVRTYVAANAATFDYAQSLFVEVFNR